jgi:hypothetical protein
MVHCSCWRLLIHCCWCWAGCRLNRYLCISSVPFHSHFSLHIPIQCSLPIPRILSIYCSISIPLFYPIDCSLSIYMSNYLFFFWSVRFMFGMVWYGRTRIVLLLCKISCLMIRALQSSDWWTCLLPFFWIECIIYVIWEVRWQCIYIIVLKWFYLFTIYIPLLYGRLTFMNCIHIGMVIQVHFHLGVDVDKF